VCDFTMADVRPRQYSFCRVEKMWKYLAAWCVMLLVSIVNGAVRDLTYGKSMDELAAHQLSSGSCIILLGILIWWFVRLYPPSSGREAIRAGLLWLGLTVVFEFAFFHYVTGHTWAELRGNYNIFRGRTWVAVLAWVTIAPYVFFRLRHSS
jgi:hypothetical protein